MKNYTSLEKMKASEVAASYTEEKVTEETFREEVKKGTLYKGFEPPKNATMLKFRYYSPEGTLIEQNNVPVVYDGTGIESVKTYYLLTDVSAGITVEKDKNGRIITGSSPDEWSEAVKTVTKTSRFLWTCTETLYTNKAVEYTEPCISAVFGEQGERGAMYLGHYEDNQAAYDANKPAVFDGDYYLNTTDSYIYVYSRSENKWAQITKFDDWHYNQSINDIFAAIEDSKDAEKFIRAKKIWVQHLAAAVARVETLYSNIIKLTQGTDLDGNKTDGVIQSDNYVAGKTGWQIKHDGSAEFRNVTVKGTVDGSTIKGSTVSGTTITGGTVNGTEIKGGSININDNFTVTSEGNLIAKTGSFEKNCVFKGYTNQGIPTATFGFLHFRYRNSTVEILEENFPLYNGESVFSITRDGTGIYSCAVRADRLLSSGDNPLALMIKDFPMKSSSSLDIAFPYENIFKTDGYQYVVVPNVMYASDKPVQYINSSRAAADTTPAEDSYVGYDIRYHLNVHCVASIKDNTKAPIFWGDGYSNYGVVANSWFFGIPYFTWKLYFTDYNTDQLIDPTGGACMILSFSAIAPITKNPGYYS